MPEEAPLEDRVRDRVMQIHSPVTSRARISLLKELAAWYREQPKHSAWAGSDDSMRSVVDVISRADALNVQGATLHQRFQESVKRNFPGLAAHWREVGSEGKHGGRRSGKEPPRAF